jgi:hypothetical protein
MKTGLEKVEDKIKAMPKTSVTEKILKDIKSKKLKSITK